MNEHPSKMENEQMIENVMIFSKTSGEVLVSSIFGSVNPLDDYFNPSLEKIQEIATKLEKGVFNLDLESNMLAMIVAIKGISAVLVFNEKLDKKDLVSWEGVAKQIVNGFEKIFETDDKAKFEDYKKTIQEIVEWQLRELSPVEKMKDALW